MHRQFTKNVSIVIQGSLNSPVNNLCIGSRQPTEWPSEPMNDPLNGLRTLIDLASAGYVISFSGWPAGPY